MCVLYIKGSTQAVRLMQINYLPIWLPDDDECKFYDCSDSVQESHWPKLLRQEILVTLLEDRVLHQATDEGARNPDQAEPEVAHVRHSTWVRRQQGWISAMLFKILVKLRGCGNSGNPVAFWISLWFWNAWEFLAAQSSQWAGWCIDEKLYVRVVLPIATLCTYAYFSSVCCMVPQWNTFLCIYLLVFVGQGPSVLGHNIFLVFCRSGTGRLLDVDCAWHKGYSATPTSFGHPSLLSEGYVWWLEAN